MALAGIVFAMLSIVSLAADTPNLLAELDAKNYAVVDAYINQVEVDYRERKISEEYAAKVFSTLTLAAATIEPRLDEWLVAYPQSFAANLIRGMFAVNRGGRARGSEYFKDIPPARLQEMYKHFKAAHIYLTKAIELDPKSTAAYAPLIRMSRIVRDDEGARRALDAAIGANPNALYARINYMANLHPNWGGSVSKMEAFVAESGRTGANEKTLEELRGMVGEAKSWPALYKGDRLRDMHDYAAALAAYDESLAVHETAVAHSRRGFAFNELGQHEKAVTELTRALELDPDLAHCCLGNRAFALLKLKRVDAAIADLITATTAGDAWSERTLISVYAFGEYGVKPDWDKAAAWCKRAADHGEGMGIYCIGGMYNEGKGGYPLDIVQATKWFEKAAEKGISDAQADTGFSYWDGRGVAIDHARAIHWWRAAAMQGNERARLKLEEELSFWEYFRYMTIPTWGYFIKQFFAWLGSLLG